MVKYYQVFSPYYYYYYLSILVLFIRIVRGSPAPMTEHRIINEYDVILCALSLIPNHLEKEDQLFAAQCIWWLASMIQFTEILSYYRHYEIFPSDYVRDCVVTPVPKRLLQDKLILELDIPSFDIDDSDPTSSNRDSDSVSKTSFLQPEWIR